MELIALEVRPCLWRKKTLRSEDLGYIFGFPISITGANCG
jgi:hypothetical protein